MLAPFESEDVPLPINLATALRLSDARPLIVAAAQAKIWVAEAQLTQAKVFWIPDIYVGADYTRHDGGGPDFNKGILTTPSVNFFYGGAGLSGVIPTTDAIYPAPGRAPGPQFRRTGKPRRPRTTPCSKRPTPISWCTSGAVCIPAASMRSSAARTWSTASPPWPRTWSPAYEVDRARNMVADLEQARRDGAAAMAGRERQADEGAPPRPPRHGRPVEHDHLQISLIDPARGLDALMTVALANRPEVASRRALVKAAEVQVREEKARPFLPIFLLNGYQTPGGMLLQAGIFGIGPNNSLNQWSGRDDVSVQFVWQLQNFGLGNLARIKKQRGEESRAITDLYRTQDKIGEEVKQAHARLESAAARVAQAERSLRTGLAALNGSVEGLSQTSRFGDVLVLISRPQEAVYAVQLLKLAFDEYFSTVAEYNRANSASSTRSVTPLTRSRN